MKDFKFHMKLGIGCGRESLKGSRAKSQEVKVMVPGDLEREKRKWRSWESGRYFGMPLQFTREIPEGILWFTK